MRNAYRFYYVTLWIFLVVLVGLLYVRSENRTQTYNGKAISIKLNTEHYLSIDTETDVQIEAADYDFFVLRKQSGESIVPLPLMPSIDPEWDSYYKAGPIQIPGGEWIISQGSPTILITSDQSVTVKSIVTDDTRTRTIADAIVAGIVACVIGIAILILLGLFDEQPDEQEQAPKSIS